LMSPQSIPVLSVKNICMIILRKSQKEGVRKIVDAWKSEKDNCRSVIFQNPMVSVLLHLRKKTGKLFVCRRGSA